MWCISSETLYLWISLFNLLPIKHSNTCKQWSKNIFVKWYGNQTIKSNSNENKTLKLISWEIITANNYYDIYLLYRMKFTIHIYSVLIFKLLFYHIIGSHAIVEPLIWIQKNFFHCVEFWLIFFSIIIKLSTQHSTIWLDFTDKSIKSSQKLKRKKNNTFVIRANDWKEKKIIVFHK